MSMNIPPHIPQVVANSAAPATESLAKANVMREVVPPAVKIETIVPQKSREQDVRPPINQSTASTYEDIQLNRNNSQIIPDSEEQSQGEQGSDQGKDSSENSASENNSEQAKQAGGESTTDEAKNERSSIEQSEEQAQQEQVRLEAKQIQELQQRDNEVKAHEQAHAAIGGTHAGAPNYEYQTGPDGKKYAVGGEVSIDVSKEATPEETIRKMQTVQAAALAPAEPSSQDRKVAAQAARNIADARAEVVQQNASSSRSSDETDTENNKGVNAQVKTSDYNSASSDSTNNDDVEIPSQMSLAKNAENNTNLFESKTAQVITNRYASSTVPHEHGFSAVA